MIRKIIFHGKYADTLGTISVDGETVADLIYACQKVKPFPPKGSRYSFIIPGYSSEEDLNRHLTNDVLEIHVYPFFAGSGGKGGFLQIVIGVAFIALAIATGGAALAAGGTGFTFFAGFGAAGIGAITSATLLKIGITLALTGLMQLLSPAPEQGAAPAGADPASNYLPSSGNTTKIGTRIPILYGHHRIGGHILSFNVDAIDRSTLLPSTPAPIVDPVLDLHYNYPLTSDTVDTEGLQDLTQTGLTYATTDSRVSINSDASTGNILQASYGLQDDFTISMWVRIATHGSIFETVKDSMTLFKTAPTTGVSDSSVIQVYLYPVTAGHGQFKIVSGYQMAIIYQGVTYKVGSLSSQLVQGLEWNHIALTRSSFVTPEEGAARPQPLILFVNGVKVFLAKATAGFTGTTGNLQLLSGKVDLETNNEGRFNGAIADLRVYPTVAMSEKQISDLMSFRI